MEYASNVLWLEHFNIVDFCWLRKAQQADGELNFRNLSGDAARQDRQVDPSNAFIEDGRFFWKVASMNRYTYVGDWLRTVHLGILRPLLGSVMDILADAYHGAKEARTDLLWKGSLPQRIGCLVSFLMFQVYQSDKLVFFDAQIFVALFAGLSEARPLPVVSHLFTKNRAGSLLDGWIIHCLGAMNHFEPAVRPNKFFWEADERIFFSETMLNFQQTYVACSNCALPTRPKDTTLNTWWQLIADWFSVVSGAIAMKTSWAVESNAPRDVLLEPRSLL